MMPHPQLRALETRYAGCRFRSRLEARWAVFFDHLGIEWEYEPEAFATSAGNYWPDFRIRFGLLTYSWHWFEVKPVDARPDRRHTALVADTGQHLILARGLPRTWADQPAHLTTVFRDFRDAVRTEWTSGFQAYLDDRVNGRGWVDLDYPQGGVDAWLVDAAYMAARSARFGR